VETSNQEFKDHLLKSKFFHGLMQSRKNEIKVEALDS
jgi:hypothetical protein